MTDSEEIQSLENSLDPDPETSGDLDDDGAHDPTTTPKKPFSDPKHLHRRPPRKPLLRPSGMVLTKVDGSSRVHHDNPDYQPNGAYARRIIPRKGREESSRVMVMEQDPIEPDPEDTGYHHSWDSDTDELYDTDLDCETTVLEMFQGDAMRDSYTWDDDDDGSGKPDVIRLADYEEACRKQGAIPMTLISRNLGNRDLDLRQSNIGSKNMKPLFVALKENLRVQRLLLDETGLDEQSLESLAEGLRDNVTISYLSLAGNAVGRTGLVPVLRLLLSNRTIQGLDLSDTKLGEDCIWLLSHIFKGNSTLRFLDVSGNSLEEEQMRLLAAAIGENRGLEFLRLSWNKIRQIGAAALGQSLTVNHKLRVLDVSWNGFGFQGAVAIAASLKKNQTLRELDISQNGINWQAALLLSSAIAKNSTLRILRMGGNPLTTTGAMDLVEGASSKKCGLRLLDISNVPVVYETEALAVSITRWRNFRLHHGGVVSTHDKLGQRLEPEKKPMQRLLDHLRARMLRPLELLREFDKSSNGRITQDEFMQRLKKASVPMHNFEMRALAASVSDKQKDGAKRINYKKLIDGVEHYTVKDRMRKIRTRMYRQQEREYHSRILSDNRPLYHRALSYTLDTPGASGVGEHHHPSSAGPHPPGSTSVTSLSRMSGRGSGGGKTVLRARESAHSLTLSLGGKASEHQPPASKRCPRRVFSLSAPLDEIGRKVKAPKVKKRTRKRGKTADEFRKRESTTTLVETLAASPGFVSQAAD